MRTLKFIVDGQSITKDPNCDFSGLVPGTEEYLQAEFSFSSEWDGFVKAAAFCSMLGNEYPPQILTDGNVCVIPAEALKRRVFTVQIVGKRGESKLITNKEAVCQKAGET